MANIYLESGDASFIVANDDSQVYDSTGEVNTIVMNDGVTDVEVASTIEDIDFSGDFADYQFQQVDGTANVVVLDGSGNPLVTLINTFTARTVSFADGTVDVVTAVSGTDIISTVGGVAITTTAAAVDTTDPDFTIDATDISSNAQGSTPGQTFTLTADDAGEITILTAGADTVNAESGSLDGSTIIDQGDTDTLNATYEAADIAGGWQPSIEDVENINVDLQVFNGGAFDATNVSGATITGLSNKTGFDGEFTATAAGDNNVVAGTNITDLIVADLDAGSVDAGSADTVTIDTVGYSATVTSVANSVTVNGDVDLDVTVDDNAITDDYTLNLTSTAASVVTLTQLATTIAVGGSVTIVGDDGVTLAADADAIVNAGDFAITGLNLDVNASTSGALDAGNFDLASFEVSTAAALDIANAQSQEVDLTAADADLTLTGDDSAGSDAILNISADQADGTTVTLVALETATVNTTADVEELESLVIVGDTTLNVAGNVVLTAFDAAAATDTLTLSGAGNVDVAAATTNDVAEVDSSGLTGNLTYAQSADAAITVTAGSGDDDITLETVDADAEVVTGDGTNTVTVAALDQGSLTVTGGDGVDTVNIGGGDAIGANGAAVIDLTLGAGDDVVEFGNVDSANDSTIVLDFGTGTADTLSLTDTDDLSGENLIVSGLDIIDMNGSASVAASLVSGEAYTIKGDGSGATLTVEGTVAAGETIDISSLVFDESIADGADTTAINGAGATGGDAITGNAATADAITLAGGGNADSVDVSTSTETILDSIENFTTTEDTVTFGGAAGSSTNFEEYDNTDGADGTSQADTIAKAVTAAEANVFDGTVQYAFIYDSDDAHTSGFLVADLDGDQTADACVELVGIVATGDMEFGDIAQLYYVK